MKFVQTTTLIFIVSGIFSCGIIQQPGDSNSNLPFANTVNYISANGLPAMDQIFPNLPPQLSLVQGVELDETGLPSKPGLTSFNASRITSTAQVEQLTVDAVGLSAQGISETRRIQSLLNSYLQPVYEVMNQKDLFSRIVSNDAGENEPISIEDLLEESTRTNATSEVLGSLFDNLLSQLTYTIELGDGEYYPHFLRLSANSSSSVISVQGLWETAQDEFVTGFNIDFSVTSANTFLFDFTFTPKLFRGMVSEWKANQCDDDLFRLRLTGTDGSTSGTISSLECATQNAQSSSLTLASNDETYSFSGSFAQSFTDAPDDSLRGFLGDKQGFVLQASSTQNFESLAASAAVLSETDFESLTPDKIQTFGVGELLAEFVNEKYWKPLLEDQDSYNGLSLSHYENPAFLLCNNFVKSTLNVSLDDGITEINALCNGEAVSGESYLAGFKTFRGNVNSTANGLANSVNSVSFGLIGKNDVLQITAGVESFLSKMVDLLTIRNNLFINTLGQVSYKDAPNDSFSSLSESLASLSVDKVEDLNWVSDSRNFFRTYTRDELPTVEFRSSLDSVRDYFRESCEGYKSKLGSETRKTDLGYECE